VYISLGGNRKGNVYANLLIVFVLTGFWHGAHFQFMAWGLWHGFFLIIERLFRIREVRNRKIIPLRYAMTMLIVVIGWVFFRSPGLRYAFKFLGIMFGVVQSEIGLPVWYYLSPKVIFLLCLSVAASTPMFKMALDFFKVRNVVILKQVTSILILVFLFVCIVFVTASSYNPFIYFRF
jgi:alginate O-acetyltransferase complex protein AlgI